VYGDQNVNLAVTRLMFVRRVNRPIFFIKAITKRIATVYEQEHDEKLELEILARLSSVK
jgi:hypothetical protein